QHKLEHFNNLTVINLPKPASDQLALLVKRSMQLQFSLQDGQIWVSDDQHTVHIEPEIWLTLH
ncbi:MAG: YaeQ family protein, partial [Methylococcaceae bacterium]|nr:YaeQ family protein [Methylococcaceae bacterium]